MANRYPVPEPSLRGRGTECALLDDVIAAIRAGESRTLVLHGEAGVGKTALLHYAVESAAEMRPLRAAGVESEMELAFASLHQLCAPLLESAERLPPPQRHALEIAFGLSEGPVPDRFLVGLALLTLLSEAARGASFALCRRRRAMAGRGVGKDARVCCAAASRGACRALARRARRRAGSSGAPRAGRHGAPQRRRARASAFGRPVSARRPRPRSHRGGDARQPARVIGAAAWIDGNAARRWLRPVGLASVVDAARGEFPTPARSDSGACPTLAAGRRRRAGRRPVARMACSRATRDRERRGARTWMAFSRSGNR